MKLEKIDHIAILVQDLDKAKDFFSDLFEIEFSIIGKLGDVRSIMDPSGIEIIEPVDPDGPAAKALKKRGQGFYVLSLKVANRDEAIAKMKSKGVRVIEQFERGKAKVALFHPKDTYGIMIEFIEYESEHPCVTALKSE